MNKTPMLRVLVFAALFASAGAAHADPIVTDGASIRGGSGVSYAIPASANSYFWGLHSDDPADGASTRTPGHGSTSPDTPFGHIFAGENVDNEVFYGSDRALSSAFHVDIAPAGDINGKVDHVHLDANIDGPGIHRLASSHVNTTFSFAGGPVVHDDPWVVYYAFEWRIATDIPANPGAALFFNLNFGGGADPGGNVDPSAGSWHSSYGDGSLSGSDFGGSLRLTDGDWRRDGTGSRTIQFAFDAVNGDGSSNPGGHAALDVWFAFSSTPFTSKPDLVPVDPVPGAVPEPASYLQMLLGLGSLAGVVCRKRS